MAGSQLLMNGNNIQIGDRATFSNVGRDQVTIYNDSGRESQWVTLNGDTYRRFHMGEIILKRNVSSTVITVTVNTRRNSETLQELGDLKVLKVRKTTQHIGLLGLPGGFTAVQVETVEKDQAEELSNIMDRLCREISSQRSPLITQLVGLGWSERPTFIFHNELTNGDEYMKQMMARENWVGCYYLWYTRAISFFTLDNDESLMIPVSPSEMFWTFDPRTHAWQYDMASVSISPPNNDPFYPIYHPPPPLRQDTRPQLDTDGIVACFEEHFGDFFHLTASLGETNHVKDLSVFARHGFLTFGAVVDRNKPEILAYFPSTPPAEWECWSRSADVQANYSTSVPWRVDLLFQDTDCNRVDLHFSLRLPDLLRRRIAYLSQSIPFAKKCNKPLNDLVFIDEVRFSLVGTFQYNPAKSTTPVYLFVPPIPVKLVDNIYCMHYPLPDTPFFWCSDSNGQNVIYEEDWDTYEIPQLEILPWIGSSWYYHEYEIVHNHLRKKNYPLDGRQYAQEHGYPELVYGDPHNPSITAIEEPDTTQEIGNIAVGNASNQAVTPGDDDSPVALDPFYIKAQEIQPDEADQTGTGAVTALPIKGSQEGSVPRIVHKLAPSRHSSQSQQNEYQSPVWPRAIYELLVLVWSIAVVVLSIGFDGVTRVVGSTTLKNTGVESIVKCRAGMTPSAVDYYITTTTTYQES
ncbi:hypothetical protein PQX77_021787 [Marasmius sp. AFHP31]|nr:hypothetical protein PQX77_021787 [Marasmius sp. AFHP31]